MNSSDNNLSNYDKSSILLESIEPEWDSFIDNDELMEHQIVRSPIIIVDCYLFLLLILLCNF